MQKPMLSLPSAKLLLTLLISTMALRLLSLALYPLMDTTEARYGEMARIMFETGNWITPMFDYDVPFGENRLFLLGSAAWGSAYLV